MKKANGAKRAPEPQPGENIQPALVNSAVANIGDPLPEGNRAELIAATNSQMKALVEDTGSVKFGHDARSWRQEYERRARAMPFVRFVANGEPLPVEIGNVDKLQAIDGSGTWYMFPTTENLRKSFGGEPEDPTQGQEAQGGPMHANTGRGEKYAGGNVETDMVADEFKNPQAQGKGSQTGGTGIQRSSVGDGAAIGGAVEDPDVFNSPDQHANQGIGKEAGSDGTGGVRAGAEENGHIRPLRAGATIKQVSKGRYEDEPGIIVQSQDPDKLRMKPGIFEIVEADRPEGEAAVPFGVTEYEGPGEPGQPTKVQTGTTDAMKEGEKTATDAAAAGAVTASASASDIEQSSPGTVGGFGGKQAADAGEGTQADMLNPLAQLDHDGNGEAGGSRALSRDWNTADEETVRAFLEENNVPITTGVQLTDLRALAEKTDRFGGAQLAKQKSDEGTPQTAGGVLAGGANAKTEEEGESQASKGTKMHIGSKAKADAEVAYPSLAGKNKADLQAVAKEEKVEISDEMTNAQITAAIEANREATRTA